MERTADIPLAAEGPAPDTPPESLDQVRDILFGGQMRMVDARLRGLEARMQEEHATMRAEFRRDVTGLDGALTKGMTDLGDRLTGESARRADELRALANDMKELVRNLERRHQSLEEAASQADAELRDQLFSLGATQSAALTRTAAELSQRLDAVAAAIRAEKLDTSALASGLTDLVHRLTSTGGSNGVERVAQE